MIEKKCETKTPIFSSPIAVNSYTCKVRKNCPCLQRDKELKADIQQLQSEINRNAKNIQDKYEIVTGYIDALLNRHQEDVGQIYNNIRNTTNELYTTINANKADIENKFAEEQQRAKNVEQGLKQDIIAETAARIIDVDTEENRAKAAEQNLGDQVVAEIYRASAEEQRLESKIDKEIQDRKDDVIFESNRAKAAEQTMQSNIDSLESKHNSDMSAMNNHLNDVIGIDAQGITEIKRVLSDNDTATGIIVELSKKADKSNVAPGTYSNVTVNNEGVVTAGSNPTTVSGYGITDVYTKAEIDALLLALTNRIATLESYWAPKTIEQETFLSTTYKIDTQGYR